LKSICTAARRQRAHVAALTVTTAPAARASSGTSASAAATASNGCAAITVTDAVTRVALQQPSTMADRGRGTSG